LLVHVIIPHSELIERDVEEDDATETGGDRAHHRQTEILKIALNKEGVNAVAVVVPAKRPGAGPIEPILQELARRTPDLVVMGSHGHGRLHHLLGSVTDTVIRNALCPVVIVPSHKRQKTAL
jgi:nucleotide-binding universal stress UspA family protein